MLKVLAPLIPISWLRPCLQPKQYSPNNRHKREQKDSSTGEDQNSKSNTGTEPPFLFSSVFQTFKRNFILKGARIRRNHLGFKELHMNQPKPP